MDTIGIGMVVVGERRREQYGDIDGLAASIDKYGLLHPIVVDAKNNLVAGERRLRACRNLDWNVIPVRRLGELTPIEIREIELEENLRRKDLTPAEKSKLMVEYVEAAEKAAKAEAEREKATAFVCKVCGESFSADVWHCPGCAHHWPMSRKDCHNCHEHAKPGLPSTERVSSDNRTKLSARGRQNEGRPQKPGSVREVEQRTGIKRDAQQRAKQHVNAFTRYPFLERPHWNQSTALEAFKALESLPEKERDRAAAMIDQPAIPPDTAIVMLRTLGIMESKDRKAVFDDFESDDEKRRTNAVCCAAQKPPMPDPRIVENEDILRRIAKAEKFGAAKEYATAREAIESLQTTLKKEYERESKALARRRGTA